MIKSMIAMTAAFVVAVLALALAAAWVLGGFPQLAIPSGGVDPVLVGAGDITNCSDHSAADTAKLVESIRGTVVALGGNLYETGAGSESVGCYQQTWGRFKTRTRPVPGNDEYSSAGGSLYYEYFARQAGETGKGYYSYNLGEWHIIALNSEVDVTSGSEQEEWLRADLAANSARCTLAYWHRPLFSSGLAEGDVRYTALWQTLYEHGTDIVLAGHDHDYERFAPQTALGVADFVYGIREFVVGTGGRRLTSLSVKSANSQVFNNDTHGVLRLTLHPTRYDWQFVPIVGRTFADSGSALCHGAPPRTTEPLQVYSADSFKRQLSRGWGSAPTGGAYTLSGPTDFAVDGLAGIVNLPSPDSTRSAFLEAISALNIQGSFRVKPSKLPSGGSSLAYLVARRVSAGNQYLGGVRFGPDGTVVLQAARVTNGKTTLLGSEVKVDTASSSADGYLRMRVRVTDTHPTKILMRVWQDGQLEPSEWQYRVTDGTEVLQEAGAVGIKLYLEPAVTNAPSEFVLTDFLVTSAPRP